MSEREALETRLGHRFGDPALLETARTHASLAAETGADRGNERLEFLGDAVLDLVAAELLYAAHPEWDEGQLTRGRAALVRKTALAAYARALELGPFLKLGRTEQQSAGAEKDTILADCFEAFVGAIYLDGGLAPVESLARRVFDAALESGPPEDPKTRFQEWAHAELRETPVYATVGDSGAEDDDRRFRVEVRTEGRVWGAGVGRSKRAAEREAATRALAEAEAPGG